MSKWYIVWSGHKPGLYETWQACQAQVAGYKGARFKAFKDITRDEAECLFHSMSAPEEDNELIYQDAIAVDASCIGNPGKMEYRGIVVETGDIYFQSKVYPVGTNNIGEFLAIVHAMALMAQQGYYRPIYSDSVTALLWVAQRSCKSKLLTTDLPKSFSLI